MTYFEIIKNMLLFLKKEKVDENLTETFLEGLNNEQIQKEIAERYRYIMFYYLHSKLLLSSDYEVIYQFLEKQLTVETESLFKTMGKVYEEVEKNFQSKIDIVSLDEIISENGQFDGSSKIIGDALRCEYISEIADGLKNISSYDLEVIITPLENVVRFVTPFLHYLFFTNKGYEYIPKKFQISDEILRKKCFDYLENVIYEYYCDREVEVNYVGLFLTIIKNIEIVFSLIKANEIEKLKRLIEIDYNLLNEIPQTEFYYHSFTSLLFNTEKENEFNIEEYLSENMSLNYLDIFLDKNSILSNLTTEEIGIVLLGYFKRKDKTKALTNLEARLPLIMEIIKNTEDSKMKRVKIYKSAWQ